MTVVSPCTQLLHGFSSWRNVHSLCSTTKESSTQRAVGASPFRIRIVVSTTRRRPANLHSFDLEKAS